MSEPSSLVAASLLSEQAVIGSMLVAPRCIAEVEMLVAARDFYRPAHEELFGVLTAMHGRGEAIDPILVVNELSARGRLAQVGGAPYIHTCMTQVQTAANVGYHAMHVRELSRVRRFRALFESGLGSIEGVERAWAADPNGQVELEKLQLDIAKVMVNMDLLVEEKMHDQQIEGLSSFTEFVSTPDRPQDWLVRDLYEVQDVWMILSAEGGGKSWYSRQQVLTMSAGMHPFRWDRHIEPVRCTLIDLENADSMIRRQSRGMHRQALLSGEPQALNENAWIWRRQAGLNLRERRDQLLFASVIDRTEPRFVAIGSLYNAFSRQGDDWETAAEEVKEFLNSMRARFGFTLLLEHHMPKGDGRDRPQTPYGSSVWQRWITHGRIITKLTGVPNLWQLDIFRGDRDQRDGIPAGLERGGQFPWAPIWTQDDIDARIELAEAERGAPRGRRTG